MLYDVNYMISAKLINGLDHWELCREGSLRPVSVILKFAFGHSSII